MGTRQGGKVSLAGQHLLPEILEPAFGFGCTQLGTGQQQDVTRMALCQRRRRQRRIDLLDYLEHMKTGW